MNNKMLKYGAVLGASAILATTIIPVSVYAYEMQTLAEPVTAPEIAKDELVQEILKDIKQEILPELRLEQLQYQERGAGGLIATLIAKYGVYDVKETTPNA